MKEMQVIDKREIFGVEFNIYGTWEEPLFLAKDVATMIEYSSDKVGQMLKSVDAEEKCTSPIHYIGQVREMWFLTEDGLYEVLMQSRKPLAKEFKREVKKILKDIRLKGYYVQLDIKDAQLDSLEKQVEELNKKLDRSIRNRWKFGLSSYNFSELAKMCGMKVSDMKDFLVTHNICYMDITTIRVTKEWKPYFDNQNRATIQGASKIFDLVQKAKGHNN